MSDVNTQAEIAFGKLQTKSRVLAGDRDDFGVKGSEWTINHIEM